MLKHGIYSAGQESAWALGVSAQIQVNSQQADSSIPTTGEVTQAQVKDPQTRQIILWRRMTRAVSPGPSPHPTPDLKCLLTGLCCLSLFKATPTSWQPMVAATPDLLLAMAISSQVSVCLRGLWKPGLWAVFGGTADP